MKVKVPVTVAAFLLTTGAISWAVLTDAREARLQRVLTSIEESEERTAFVGIRHMGGPETVKLRVWSRDGQKRVDFLGVENPTKKPARAAAPRLPFGGSMPVFLRPGREQWKKKIKDAALAVRNYRIIEGGRDVVAGRECEVIEVLSRHEGRPSYRVAADLANRFPLRYEVIANGQIVFETHFAEIQYNPTVPAGTFETRKRPDWLTVSQDEVPVERMAAEAGFTVFRPSVLPKGFEMRGSELIRVKAELSKELQGTLKPFLPFPLPKLDATVAHFTYTDGIAAVAVVECSASSELWQHLKKWIPGTATVATGDQVIAKKFSDRGGSAYLLEVGGTVVLAAGNVAPVEIESMIRTLERR